MVVKLIAEIRRSLRATGRRPGNRRPVDATFAIGFALVAAATVISPSNAEAQIWRSRPGVFHQVVPKLFPTPSRVTQTRFVAPGYGHQIPGAQIPYGGVMMPHYPPADVAAHVMGTAPPLSSPDPWTAPVTAFDSQYRESADVDSLPYDRSNLPLESDLDHDHLSIGTPVLPTNTSAQRYQWLSEHQFRRGHYASAARLADEAIAVDTGNGRLLMYASHANFASGRYRVAIDQLRDGLDLLPKSQWDWFGHDFQAFYGRNDYVGHARELAAYTRRRPEDHLASTLLGYQLGIFGHRAAASELFHQALRKDPRDGLTLELLSVLGDPNAVAFSGEPVEAPSPSAINAYASSAIYRAPARHRIYLTSPWSGDASHSHIQPPMSNQEIVEAPGELFIPSLDGPDQSVKESSDDLEEATPMMEELPFPLEPKSVLE